MKREAILFIFLFVLLLSPLSATTFDQFFAKITGQAVTDTSSEGMRCLLSPAVGSGKAAITRFYYDPLTNSCKTFIWGGVGGVVPFDTAESCTASCVQSNLDLSNPACLALNSNKSLSTFEMNYFSAGVDNDPSDIDFIVTLNKYRFLRLQTNGQGEWTNDQKDIFSIVCNNATGVAADNNPGCYASKNNLDWDYYDAGNFDGPASPALDSLDVDFFVGVGRHQFRYFQTNGVSSAGWQKVDLFSAWCPNPTSGNSNNPGCYAQQNGISRFDTYDEFLAESSDPANGEPAYADIYVTIGRNIFIYQRHGFNNYTDWQKVDLFSAWCDSDSRSSTIKNIQNPGCYAQQNGISRFDYIESGYFNDGSSPILDVSSTVLGSTIYKADTIVGIGPYQFQYFGEGLDGSGALQSTPWQRVDLFDAWCPEFVPFEDRLNETENPQPTSCVDSDGGLNYFIRGNANYAEGLIPDECVVGGEHDGWLREISCNNNAIQLNDYKCPLGCSDGACIPSASVSQCSDSDDGRFPNVFGVANATVNNILQSFADSCLSSSQVLEYSCQMLSTGAVGATPTTLLVSEPITCASGFICSNGACVANFTQYNPNKCSDSDGGFDIFTRGTITASGPSFAFTNNDTCEGNLLTEYYCQESGFLGSTQTTCAQGCSNGVCLGSVTDVVGCVNPFNAQGPSIPSRTRVEVGSQLRYCDPIDLTFKVAKVADDSCTSDYQCESNACIEGLCTSIRSAIETQTGWLKRIYCSMTAFFDHPVNGSERTAAYNACIQENS